MPQEKQRRLQMISTVWMGSQNGMIRAAILQEIPILIEDALKLNRRYAVVMPSLNLGEDFVFTGEDSSSWKLIGRGLEVFRGCMNVEDFSVTPHVTVMEMDQGVKKLSIVITW